MRDAYIFPGQGSQSIGMGQALAQNFAAAREIFAHIDDALSQHLSRLMFDGDLAELTLTQNAQPAIFAVSAAALTVLQTEAGLNVSNAAFVAGHSLGEYSALYAAGVFDLATTAQLLRTRGNAMQQAVPVGQGAMAAVLGLEAEPLAALCAQVSRQDMVCAIANDNAPGQIVISGHAAAVAALTPLAKEAGAKRVLPLNVSAPFHCSLMQPAAHVMANALEQTLMNDAGTDVVCNVDARVARSAQTLRQNLVTQVTGSVLWRQSVAAMAQAGVTRMVEIGAGQVLSGLVKRIAPSVTTCAVGVPADIATFLQKEPTHV